MLLTRLIAALAMLFLGLVGAVQAADVRGAPPAAGAGPDLTKFAGKRISIQHEIDLDGDGEATETEANTLSTLLQGAGAKVWPRLGADAKPGDILVLGELPIINRSFDLDAAELDRVTRLQEDCVKYAKTRAKTATDLKAAGVTVLEGPAIRAYFGFDRCDVEAVRKLAVSNAAATLTSTIPNAKFDAVSFEDAISWVREHSKATIWINWRDLESSGLDRTSKVSLNQDKVTVRDALEELINQLAKEKLQVLVDRSGTATVMTRETAAQLQKTRPGNFVAATQLENPPKDFITVPAALAPLARQVAIPELADAPLPDAVDLLAKASHLKIAIDPLLFAGGPASDIHIHMQGFGPRSVGQALAAMVSTIDGHSAAAYVDTSGTIHLTTRAELAKKKDVAATIPDAF